ncbi:ABC transporter permease subunit [Spirulina major CS-329]|uniref:ABC transporter permease n=1 Tax=Spirulina TaxID=1154 RepID=UPI00232E8022|nr:MULTISPECIES: ABC transporter permease subunit [Spirulina]MDB9496388.1 ABC transporter permease subunit [Spirulina subsalsa CS-330]MDB9504707.1 ABC transporter permease subunit [Spirulina major CS-329]
MLEIFETYTIPLGDWVEIIVQFVVDNFRPIFQAIRTPVSVVLSGIEAFFQWLPPLVLIVAVGLIAWQLASRGIAIYSMIALLFVGFLGTWSQAMTTLALVLTAVCFCILIGIPLGILSAWNQRFEQTMRPVLDAMQTLPAFVYLVPVVMLFGIGEVPGVIVTFIFAVPPLIRLTNIGIQQVSEEVVEAAIAFGSTPRQILWEAQIPLAMPTILAGVNQAIMLALSMVVVASMISVEGLGQMVLRGIGRLDVGLATVGGISIVLIAVMLDRLTQAVGKPHRLPWRKRGPVGLVLSLTQGKTRTQNATS